jgi:hypothetical protein
MSDMAVDITIQCKSQKTPRELNRFIAMAVATALEALVIEGTLQDPTVLHVRSMYDFSVSKPPAITVTEP